MSKKYEDLSKEELLKKLSEFEQELKNKKYGLVWESEKFPEQVVLDCENNLPILEEVKEKEIKNNNVETKNLLSNEKLNPVDINSVETRQCLVSTNNTQNNDCNILIEGDNYHALTVLNYTHENKIDVIYIDPPYNTGNKDFIYNDHYVDKEDSYRHSKWLNFMEKRLKLAKNLLKEDGVIFISIDDNEQAQLKLLCDKIFGEENFVSNLSIETGEVFGTKSVHANKTFVKVKDYVLVYFKGKFSNNEKMPLFDNMRDLYDGHYSTIIDEKLNKTSFKIYLEKIKWVKDLFEENSLKINSNNISLLMNFNDKFKNFIYNDIADLLYADAPLSKNIDIFTLNKYEVGKPFIFENKLVFKTGTGSVRMYLSFKESLKNSDDYKTTYGRCSIRGDLWKGFHFDMRNVQDEGNIDFKNGKKPIRLIKQLLKWCNNKNSIILDFFAGSGTTGHAVLDLNKEDSGNRKFILCTNNQNNICEEVTYKRLEKVMNGYNKNGDGEFIEGLGGNLKYFKTSLVKKSKSRSQLKIDITEKCTEMLCLKESIFEDFIKKDNYKIFTNIKKDKYLAIYYNFIKDDFGDFIEELKKLNTEIIVYVFSVDNRIDEKLFKGLDVKLEAIPQKILEVYKSLMKI